MNPSINAFNTLFTEKFCKKTNSSEVVSHLQGTIKALISDSDSDLILRCKELLVEQLASDFVQDNKPSYCETEEQYDKEMEVDNVNAFINYFADELGLIKRPRVTTDAPLIQKNSAAGRQTLTEKLPVALVSYLSEELCLAGRQALQGGELKGEPLQHFLETPLVTFFESSGIIRALVVQDEESGHYAVPTHFDSLHWLVARHLMAQGWLQLQEPRLLLDQELGALYTLSDYWFCWQSKKNSEDQRPLTSEELLKLFAETTPSPSDQAMPLPRLARRLLELAAEQGSAEAALKLVDCYQKEGIAYKRSALKDYQLAANQGNVYAQRGLGLMYLDESYENTVVDEDAEKAADKKAFKYFKLAADQGDVLSQYNLGDMYQKGQGVDWDAKQAYKYFKLAADQGNDKAQYNLGLLHFYGGEGIDQDMKKAVEFLKLAANQGNTDAQDAIDASLTSDQKQKVTEGRSSTLSDSALAEAMSSFGEQQKVCQVGGDIANSGLFPESILNQFCLDKNFEE
jgi:TPR repeat protein